MKSFKKLWRKIVNPTNIAGAIRDAAKGKRNRSTVKDYQRNQDEIIFDVQEMLGEMTWEPKEHTPFVINDGVSKKVRIIVKPYFGEQIIHHSLIRVLKKVLLPMMHPNSCGSLPGRGGHLAKKKVEKHIRRHNAKNYKRRELGKGEKSLYFLKMDIRHFFQNINHDILMKLVCKTFKEHKLRWLIWKIVDNYYDHIDPITGTKYGLPIGFYTSQWFANWFLSKLDYYITNTLKADFYVRYMDDMVIFGTSKRQLHEMEVAIEDFLRDELDLELKDNWQVALFDSKRGKKRAKGRPLDFVGFKFYRNRTTLRRGNFLRAKRKAKKMKKKGVNSHTAMQMMSYLSWFIHSDTKHAYHVYIEQYINVCELKIVISKHQKRLNKKKKTH